MTGGPQTPAFNHRDTGTAPAAWSADPRWGEVADADPWTGTDRLVVLAAHPDDEALGAGGLIAEARERGVRCVVLCATLGERSHPDSPTLTSEQLAACREREVQEAMRTLGAGPPVCLRLPDGALAEHVPALVHALVDLIGEGRRTLLVAPWSQDGHPDHEAAGQAARVTARRTGARLWEYPLWFWHWGTPAALPWEYAARTTLTGVAWERKQQAIAAHASQVRPLSAAAGDEPVVSAALLARAAGPDEVWVLPTTEQIRGSDEDLDRLHAEVADPWGVDTTWYERRKQELVLAMLPEPRVGTALDVGCSTGALTAALTARADVVTAVDRSPQALAAAARRLGEGVRLECLDVPEQWPEGRWDLVVVSEIGYFLSPPDVDRLAARVASSLAPGGAVVLCHFRGDVEGWAMDSETVHRQFAAAGLPPLGALYRDPHVEILVHGESVPEPGR